MKGYNLGQRAWLKFAQLDEQCGVHHIDVRGRWELKQLCKDHLQNIREIHILQPNPTLHGTCKENELPLSLTIMLSEIYSSTT